MLNAPTDLHRSQHLMHDAERLMHRVYIRLEQSNKLIARGETRTVARAHAAVTSDETFPEGTVSHASEHE
jgi:hypothetical protein